MLFQRLDMQGDCLPDVRRDLFDCGSRRDATGRSGTYAERFRPASSITIAYSVIAVSELVLPVEPRYQPCLSRGRPLGCQERLPSPASSDAETDNGYRLAGPASTRRVRALE